MSGPMLPCGHRTRHTSRVGCCSGCGLLFSSDSAFEKHRRHGACLTPEDAGLVARDSRTAPGEVVYSLPGGGKRRGHWTEKPQDAIPALGDGPKTVDQPEVAHLDTRAARNARRAAR